MSNLHTALPSPGRCTEHDLDQRIEERLPLPDCSMCSPEHLADPRDVDMSHVFPLEKFFRRHPSAPFWLVLAVALIGAAIDTPQLWSH